MACSLCGNDNPYDAPFCLGCGSSAFITPAGRPGPPPAPGPYRLGGLANAVTVLLAIAAMLLIIEVATWPVAPVGSGSGFTVHGGLLGVTVLGVVVATVALFLAWFYRARKNAELSSWPQRRSPGWAIGSWIVPPVLLWFPYQIMADIWQAARRPWQLQGTGRPPSALLPRVWWAAWALAWLTSFVHPSRTSDYALDFGGTRPSAAFLAVAAIALVVIIRAVSRSPHFAP